MITFYFLLITTTYMYLNNKPVSHCAQTPRTHLAGISSALCCAAQTINLELRYTFLSFSYNEKQTSPKIMAHQTKSLGGTGQQGSQDRVHPSRRWERPPPPYSAGNSYRRAYTVNELKTRIRSLRRLLGQNDRLPAGVRVERQRALRTAESELERNQRAKDRSEMISRFHKIRFFDRQKATKRLNRAKKELLACEEDEGELRDELEKKVTEAKIDLNYATYYPLDRPYHPLFPSRTKYSVEIKDLPDQANAEPVDGYIGGQKGNAEMRELVIRCMEEHELDKLKEGKLTRHLSEVPDKQTSAASGSGNQNPAGSSQGHNARKIPHKPEGAERNEEMENGSGEDGASFFE